MCNHNTLKEVVIERRVWVDECISDAIVRLNQQGIYTTGCCCGHGKAEPTAVILPSSVKRAENLGYEVVWDDTQSYIVLDMS